MSSIQPKTTSLTTLFKHIESVDEPITDENLRERTLIFIKDKDAASLAVAILKKKLWSRTFLGCDNHPLSSYLRICMMNMKISFTWVREYHWDVRGEDAEDPTIYLVAFDESEARYVPLHTELVLRKKRATEGKSSDEVKHFPAPARVTVRWRSKVSAVELKEIRVIL